MVQNRPKLASSASSPAFTTVHTLFQVIQKLSISGVEKESPLMLTLAMVYWISYFVIYLTMDTVLKKVKEGWGVVRIDFYETAEHHTQSSERKGRAAT